MLSHSVVGAAIGSDGPIGIGVQHGWRAVGEPMVVTSSAENQVLTLDDQPALAAYLRRLDAPPHAHIDGQAFTRFALTHPLGLSRRSGDEVRFVAGADFGKGSLNCIAAVPQGSLAWIMEGDRDSVLEATNVACDQALSGLGGRSPLGLLAFDCIARKGVLGETASRMRSPGSPITPPARRLPGFTPTVKSPGCVESMAFTTRRSSWLPSRDGVKP